MDVPATPSAVRKPADFAIDSHGVWSYRGSPIKREGLLRLLSGMLRRDARGYALATPEQTLRVDVVDVPFIITEWELQGEGERASIRFRNSLGESSTLDAEHPLCLRAGPDGGIRPYVVFRDGMEAVLHRNVFYALAGIAQQREADGPHGVHSEGLFFPLE